jgi:hypothetical protein
MSARKIFFYSYYPFYESGNFHRKFSISELPDSRKSERKRAVLTDQVIVT